MTEKTKPLDLKEIFEKHKWELNKDEVSNQIATVITKHIGGVNVIYEKHNKEINELKKEIKQRIKQACEFFLINKADCDLDQFGLLDVLDECIKLGLDKKDKKWFDNFYKRVKELCKDSHFDVSDLIDEYNEWLFKLAFKSVLGEKNG